MKKTVFCAVALSAGIALAAFDVRDFGAKGDGVTDDTAAFQAAIDAVAARGAGKIVIPYSPKGYRIAGPGRESFDGKPCRGQLVIPPTAKNIAFEGEMPCKLLYSYQVPACSRTGRRRRNATRRRVRGRSSRPSKATPAGESSQRRWCRSRTSSSARISTRRRCTRRADA